MLSLEEKARCLSKGVFSELSESMRLAVAERLGERHFEDGEKVFIEGEAGNEAFFVVSGQVVVLRGGATLAGIGQGELLGEMSVLGGGGLRTATAVARGKTHLLFLKDKALKLLICQNPNIAFAIFKMLIERLQQSNELSIFLSRQQKPMGYVEVLSSGEKVPLYQREAELGFSSGSILTDGLRVALKTADPALKERHALVSVDDRTIYLQPMEGETILNGTPITESVAVTPSDEVRIGGLKLKFVLEPE